MNTLSQSETTAKEKIISFIWQHLLLLVSLFIMTFGVALSVRSNLGSSVISTIPFVMSLAGEAAKAPGLTIGEYTYVMNFLLVGLQILILRRRFHLVQLFQLIIGFVFGFLLDINMWLTSVYRRRSDMADCHAADGLSCVGYRNIVGNTVWLCDNAGRGYNCCSD